MTGLYEGLTLKTYILLTLLWAFVSCSSTNDNKVSHLDQVYISSGVEQYFLPDMPYWANFSHSSGCFRKNSIRFLNYNNLHKSLNLNYNQSTHIQHMINRKLYAYRTTTGNNDIPLRDEMTLFHNIYQQVVGGSTDFIVPQFKKISLVWIDPYLTDMKKIKKLMKSPKVLSAYPVMISHCLMSYEMEDLIGKLGLESLGIKNIPAEMLSIYGTDLKRKAGFSVNVDLILKEKEIIFYAPYESSEVRGNYKLEIIK